MPAGPPPTHSPGELSLAARNARAYGLLYLVFASAPLLCLGLLGERWFRGLDPTRDAVLGLSAPASVLLLSSFLLIFLAVALSLAVRCFRRSRLLSRQR